MNGNVCEELIWKINESTLEDETFCANVQEKLEKAASGPVFDAIGWEIMKQQVKDVVMCHAARKAEDKEVEYGGLLDTLRKLIGEGKKCPRVLMQ